MDPRFFVTIANRLDKPKDSRLSYTTEIRPTYLTVPPGFLNAGSVQEGSTHASVFLHGPAGTVQLLWQQESKQCADLMTFAGIQVRWYERLSIEWHSRKETGPVECHTTDCQVFARGPYGPGECWHTSEMMAGMQLGRFIESGCWAALSETLESTYKDYTTV